MFVPDGPPMKYIDVYVRYINNLVDSLELILSKSLFENIKGSHELAGILLTCLSEIIARRVAGVNHKVRKLYHDLRPYYEKRSELANSNVLGESGMRDLPMTKKNSDLHFPDLDESGKDWNFNSSEPYEADDPYARNLLTSFNSKGVQKASTQGIEIRVYEFIETIVKSGEFTKKVNREFEELIEDITNIETNSSS